MVTKGRVKMRATRTTLPAFTAPWSPTAGWVTPCDTLGDDSHTAE